MLDCIAALRDVAECSTVALIALADGPLVRRAQALGAEVQVIEPPRALIEFGEGAGPRSIRRLTRQLVSAPAGLYFLARLRHALIRMRSDVVHSNGMKTHLLAGVVTPPSQRLVAHLHDFVGARSASRHLLPVLARVRDRVVFVANSMAVAEDFRGLAPRADVRTAYNVVDVDYFSPGVAEEAWLAEAAHLDPPAPGTVSFGLVATYARWKGHQFFIEAAGRLRAAHPEAHVRFYIVGGPIYQTLGSQVCAADLQRWARNAGISDVFGLVPFQDDIARVYRSLNVVVHASIQPEPFGRIIVEAMACARPVVVSQAGGAAELFQDGENALGFEPGNAENLANAMGRLLDARARAALGHAARQHAVSHFSRARYAGELLSVYRS